jgi:SAM-dependent methyltransferase
LTGTPARRTILRMMGDARMFHAAAATYDRFVGRYGDALAAAHVAPLGLRRGDRALDVGCGPGALTAALAGVVGPTNVCAVDPSEPFVEACRERVPGADVRVATAERLPDFAGDFALASSQLVVNFMADAESGVRAMRDVVRPGGTVASVVWDYAEDMTMLRAFWDAALELDPGAPDEGRTMPYCTPDALRLLWQGSGLDDIRTSDLVVHATYDDFEDFWAPFPTGVGPAGAYCAGLEPEHRAALATACFRRLGSPTGPFALSARAWFVRGQRPRSRGG